MLKAEIEDLEYDYLMHNTACSSDGWASVNMVPPTAEEVQESFRSAIDAARSEAWDQGRVAAQEWRDRQNDADAAGQGVLVRYPSNPYKVKQEK